MKAGDKVICLDSKDTHDTKKYCSQWIVEKAIYTVRRIEGSLTGETRVLLEEVRNAPVFITALQGKVEPGFAGKRFADLEQYLLSNSVEEVVELEGELAL